MGSSWMGGTLECFGVVGSREDNLRKDVILVQGINGETKFLFEGERGKNLL